MREPRVGVGVVMVTNAAAMAASSAARVRAPLRRNAVLSLLNACSIGAKSGEYGGKNRTRQPRAAISRAATALLWTLKLSQMTSCPGVRDGPRIRSTKTSKASPPPAASMRRVSPPTSSTSPAPTGHGALRTARRAQLADAHAPLDLGQLATLFLADERRASLVTVQDGASHSLAFLGSAYVVPVVPLGVHEFGQSGSRQALYQKVGIDADQIVNAAMLGLDLANG